MFHFALDGLWLIGALGLAYLVGVFTAQKVKDTVNGVPGDLRTALSATESSALAEISKAKAAAIADVGKLFSKAATATAAASPAAPLTPAPAPTAAAPAAKS